MIESLIHLCEGGGGCNMKILWTLFQGMYYDSILILKKVLKLIQLYCALESSTL